MKIKTLLLVLILACGISAVNAQMVEKDSKFLNFGIGLGTNIYAGRYDLI